MSTCTPRSARCDAPSWRGCCASTRTRRTDTGCRRSATGKSSPSSIGWSRGVRTTPCSRHRTPTAAGCSAPSTPDRSRWRFRRPAPRCEPSSSVPAGCRTPSSVSARLPRRPERETRPGLGPRTTTGAWKPPLLAARSRRTPEGTGPPAQPHPVPAERTKPPIEAAPARTHRIRAVGPPTQANLRWTPRTRSAAEADQARPRRIRTAVMVRHPAATATLLHGPWLLAATGRARGARMPGTATGRPMSPHRSPPSRWAQTPSPVPTCGGH